MNVREQFRHHIETHSKNTGFDMPILLSEYLVDLLSSRVDKTDIIPEPSFAECYLKLYQETKPAPYKDFADTCLFFTSLLPDYGKRRGLSIDYYATLGISTYYALGDMVDDDRYIQLGNWFNHLQKFLNSAIRPEVRLELYKI